jgi:hypothetical protein
MTMSDDKSNRGPADRSRVSTSEDYEVRYWTNKFGCTAQQLRDAVKKVGPMANDVERELRKR